MLIETYKEFNISEKVKVKKDIIYGFLLSHLNIGSFPEQMPVIDYVIHENNLLTIKEIDYDARFVLPAQFTFFECIGTLYYGQFVKCFPALYVFSQDDFKDKL